jgi:hypothetical protein
VTPDQLLQDLRPVTLGDRGVFETYLTKYPQEICESPFAERFLWGEARKHLWGELEGHLVVCFQKRDGGRLWYAPVGPDPAALIGAKMSPNDGFSYWYVPENVASKLKEFAVTETPDNFDYVYDVAALKTLEGKPYAEKRNFINRAKKLNPETVLLNSSMKNDVIDLLYRWAKEDTRAGESTLLDEEEALALSMENFEALGLFGIGIRINGRLEAFSYGCMLNASMFVEYFEKATTAAQGLYPLAVHELCKALPAHFTELNLEEDLGIPGLKIAKQRWNPKRMVKKYSVTKK